jgi:hypothetical protein
MERKCRGGEGSGDRWGFGAEEAGDVRFAEKSLVDFERGVEELAISEWDAERKQLGGDGRGWVVTGNRR